MPLKSSSNVSLPFAWITWGREQAHPGYFVCLFVCLFKGTLSPKNGVHGTHLPDELSLYSGHLQWYVKLIWQTIGWMNTLHYRSFLAFLHLYLVLFLGELVNPHCVNCKSNAKLMSVTFVMWHFHSIYYFITLFLECNNVIDTVYYKKKSKHSVYWLLFSETSHESTLCKLQIKCQVDVSHIYHVTLSQYQLLYQTLPWV